MGDRKKLKGIAVWLHYGWYADLALSDVTAPQFDALESFLVYRNRFDFRDGRKYYNLRDQMTYIEFHDLELMYQYVERGVLTKPNLAVELAVWIEKLLQEKLKEYS